MNTDNEIYRARFLVIGDYPSSPFQIGDIFEEEAYDFILGGQLFSEFPRLFKALTQEQYKLLTSKKLNSKP